MHVEKTQYPLYARIALILLAIVLILFLLSVGRTIFIPLVFSMLIASMLYPLACRLERFRVPRSLSSLICMLVFVGCVSLFVYFFTVQIFNFANDLPALQHKFQDMLIRVQHYISYKYHITNSQQIGYVTHSAEGYLSTATAFVSGLFINSISLFIFIVFTLIYSYFLLYHRALLKSFLINLFTPQHRAKTSDVIMETRKVVNGYVSGLVIEMLILFAVTTIVLMVLHVKYALLLGALAAVLNIIPYIGIYSAILISMVISFANASLGQMLTVGAALLSIHFIDANIMMPRIVGARMKMNPFITLVAVIVGELIWGIPGMFLFVPITAILKIIFERVDGLKPWAMLIGTEEKPAPAPPLPAEDKSVI